MSRCGCSSTSRYEPIQLVDQLISVIPHSRPSITAGDIRAVTGVLRRGHLAQGEEVRRFEAEAGGFLAFPPGVAVSSGTAALHLALLALDIKPGDEVILPSYVCVAPLHALEYVGATPILADVDPDGFNIDPDDAKARLTPRTRAMIVPHLFGLPAELDPLLPLGVPILEDCAQAFSAEYRGRLVGTMGTLSVVSFYATKLMTTGEGGMVFGRDTRLLRRLQDLRDYDERREHRLRFNYKLTDMQAALGRSQLRRFPATLTRRRTIASRYCGRWRHLPVRLPVPADDRTHAYHRFVLGLQSSAVRAASRLAALGITARRPVFRPLHHLLGQEGFPGTDEVFRHALSVPIYPDLTEREERCVTDAVLSLFA